MFFMLVNIFLVSAFQIFCHIRREDLRFYPVMIFKEMLGGDCLARDPFPENCHPVHSNAHFSAARLVL